MKDKPSFKSFCKHEITTGVMHHLIHCDVTGRVYKERRSGIAFTFRIALLLAALAALIVTNLILLNTDMLLANLLLSTIWIFAAIMLLQIFIPLRYLFAKFDFTDEEWTAENQHHKTSQRITTTLLQLLIFCGAAVFMALQAFDLISQDGFAFMLPMAIATVITTGVLAIAALAFLVYLLIDERRYMKKRSI